MYSKKFNISEDLESKDTNLEDDFEEFSSLNQLTQPPLIQCSKSGGDRFKLKGQVREVKNSKKLS